MEKLYAIEGGQLRALRAVATRLHSERRMDGDEMRDLGHTLAAIVTSCEQLEIPDETPEVPSRSVQRREAEPVITIMFPGED